MISMQKQKKKYFHWQIKYFIRFFLLHFLLCMSMQSYSNSEQGISYNIIYFHVPVAWASIFVYFYIAYKYIIYARLHVLQVYGGIWYTFYALLSGFVWGYLVFGKFGFIDLKIFTYFLLFLTLIAIYWTSNIVYSNILLIMGLYFYIESRFSVTYLNTLHQNFLMDFYVNQNFNSKPFIYFFFSEKYILFLLAFFLIWQIILVKDGFSSAKCYKINE